MTTASMSRPGHARVVERALRGLAHEPGASRRPAAWRRTSSGRRRRPRPAGSRGTFQDATRFCCRHGPLVACTTARSALAAAIAAAAAGEPLQAADHASGLAFASHRRAVEPERLTQEQLLVRIEHVQPRRVDVRAAPALLAGRPRPTARSVRSRTPSDARLDAVVHAADPHRRLRQRAGAVADREHDRGGTVGDVRSAARRERRRTGRCRASPAPAGRRGRARPATAARRSRGRAGSTSVRSSSPARRPREGVDERRVDVARPAGPRPPRRARTRRPSRRATRGSAARRRRVERADEGEREALQVVARPGDGEADVALGQADLAERFVR